MADSSILSIFNDFGIPVPSMYQAGKDSADQDYQNAISQIAQRQQAVSNSYGFKPQVNQQTGALEDMRIDPTLAYSKVMSGLNAHAGDMSTLRDNLAGRGLAGAAAGQGHQLSGLAAQRANLLRFQQQGETAGIGADYTSQMGGFQNDQANALHTRGVAYNQAAQDSINYAISNGLFNKATIPGGGDGSGGGGPTAPLPGQAQTPAQVAHMGTAAAGHALTTGFQTIGNMFGGPAGQPANRPTTANPRAGQTARNSF